MYKNIEHNVSTWTNNNWIELVAHLCNNGIECDRLESYDNDFDGIDISYACNNDNNRIVISVGDTCFSYFWEVNGKVNFSSFHAFTDGNMDELVSIIKQL